MLNPKFSWNPSLNYLPINFFFKSPTKTHKLFPKGCNISVAYFEQLFAVTQIHGQECAGQFPKSHLNFSRINQNIFLYFFFHVLLSKSNFVFLLGSSEAFFLLLWSRQSIYWAFTFCSQATIYFIKTRSTQVDPFVGKNVLRSLSILGR